MIRCKPPALTLALLLLPLAGLATLGCDERGGGGTVVPGERGSDSELEPEGEFEGESMDELEIRLDRLVEGQGQLVAAGNQDPDKCEELCELSQAICEVKTKMCEIADGRVADDEYQNLCRKAKQRCAKASQSCTRCVEHHQRAGSSSGSAEPADCRGEPEPTPAATPAPEPAASDDAGDGDAG